jgi:hypothetical protein
MGILIFKGLNAQRLYKSFGVKGLKALHKQRLLSDKHQLIGHYDAHTMTGTNLITICKIIVLLVSEAADTGFRQNVSSHLSVSFHQISKLASTKYSYVLKILCSKAYISWSESN